MTNPTLTLTQELGPKKLSPIKRKADKEVKVRRLNTFDSAKAQEEEDGFDRCGLID